MMMSETGLRVDNILLRVRLLLQSRPDSFHTGTYDLRLRFKKK